MNKTTRAAFPKHHKPKLIVEAIGGNCSTIILSLRCFWKTQPRAEFPKALWAKLIVGTIFGGNFSTIYLGLRCFWEMQPLLHVKCG